ncbi:uncharacterized protein LOC133036232 [Cannabis sativa]|uniref:uncharacterized protein LOC133036232 n=1 Tax=Cannabis sativa TaxID=3483 RepID=UPI0029C9DCB3|nr:uncharacterized protein LOC133036232 [Cannabis sativa]
MEVDQVPQLAKCRILAATLEDNAHNWFSQLPEASISTWETFVDLFLTNFQATMMCRPPYTTLANIKQEVGESLQDYFKRFNAEVTKVENAPESSLVCMLITGVLPRTDFWKELQARRPKSLVQFFAMAEPHKRIKNSLAEQERGKDKNESLVPRSRSRNPRGRSPQRQRSLKLAKSPPKKESSPKRKGGPRFVNYTELATPRDHIYVIEERMEFSESLPQSGEIATRETQKSSVNITRILAIPHWNKECDDITFMESDARKFYHPHADALVIVANIGGDNVHRILVDNGSSVNLISFQAFKQMGLQEKDLRPVVLSIYGFTGDKIALKGMIKLPITLGTAPVAAKLMADFAVIDQYSVYNAVIGRPILKPMKIVTSIYHLTMKSPTPAGVGSI